MPWWGWIISIVYILSGMTGIWYWWTENMDMRISQMISLGLFGACCGPLWWIIVFFQYLGIKGIVIKARHPY